MYDTIRYTQKDSMSSLINNNYSILLVISRFGIKLGFSNKTIEEVCRENGVDTKTFLTIVNMLIDEDNKELINDTSLSIITILNYLQYSHKYFLDFKLPQIRIKLKDATKKDNESVSIAIMKFFEEYVLEVKKHMDYEDKYVFPYIKSLLENKKNAKYNIEHFVKQHNDIESKLSELKDIIIKYCPVDTNNELIDALFEIFSCSKDLSYHNEIENRLLVPIIQNIEKHKKR